MDHAASQPDPPRKVEARSVRRFASNLEMNASWLPLNEVSNAPFVAGKSVDWV